jgi:acetyl esterase/lipase
MLLRCGGEQEVSRKKRATVKTCTRHITALAIITFGSIALLHAQQLDSLASTIHIADSYRIAPDVTYRTVAGVDDKLDVYQSRTAKTPSPTLVFIHGGNWVGGSKAASSLMILPFLDMGWNVVNIDYRLLHTAPAPAGADDCFCALRWVYQHAKQYNIDTSRVVVSGNSAGGHLALLLAMAPASAKFGTDCPGPEDLRVAGVINWYGFSDLVDLLEGPNARPAVQNWIGTGPRRQALAKRLSPISYVRMDEPPILTIQGDADPTSPYEYTVLLHQELTRVGVPNRLLTVPGGKHGGFTDAETATIYQGIRQFLREHDLQ